MSQPTTLYTFYRSLGLRLPSIAARADLFEEYGLGAASSYRGTAQQNTLLLNALTSVSGDPTDVIEQSREALESVTVADVRGVLGDAEVLDMLAGFGVPSEYIDATLDVLGSASDGATLYDLVLGLMENAPDGGGPPSTVPFEIPDDIVWTQPRPGSGLFESPVYTVTPGSRNWSLSGLFPDIDPRDAAFYAGQGWGALADGASEALTNVATDLIRAAVPAPLYNLLESVSEAESLSGLLREFHDDILEEITQTVASLGIDSADVARLDRIQTRIVEFRDDIQDLAVSRVGESTSAIWNAFGRLRTIISFSDNAGSRGLSSERTPAGTASAALQFSTQNASVRASFAATGRQRVAVLASSRGDRITGGASHDVLVGQQGLDRLTAGAGNDQLWGGGGNDILRGDGGNDMIAGGEGADRITTGLGNDTIRFRTQADRGDVISDFRISSDRLEFNRGGFGNLRAGSLSAGQFQSRLSGSAAGGRNTRFIYDRRSGSLYFDADGTGRKAAVKIATLGNRAAISASDIFIV